MRKFLAKSILIIADFLWLVGLFYATLYICKNITWEAVPSFAPITLRDFLFVIFIIVLLFYYEKIYDFRFDFWQELLKIFKSLLIAFFIVLALLALTKTNLRYSRLFILIYFALALFTLPIFKRIFKRVLYHFGLFKERVLVLGKSKDKERFIDELRKNWYLGAEPSENAYDRVIILSQGFDTQELGSLVDIYLQKVSDVYIVPYLRDISFTHSNIFEYTNLRLNTIQIQNKLLLKKNILIKNILDGSVSLLLFMLFLVLHIPIVILIKLDSPGPIFYRQKRLGKNGKVFELIKYRTMYENSDELLEEYLRKHPDEKAYYEKYHKYSNDPRITRVGRWLRSTSLDELPQLLNVCNGEMNLIGPRPYMLEEEERLGKDKELILQVKPGLTGLWQVSGRNNLEFDQRIMLEKWYIKNWSVWADIVILLKTFKAVVAKIGAK